MTKLGQGLRVKVDFIPGNGYYIRLASDGVNNYNMHILVPDLDKVSQVLAHHFEAHPFDPSCPQCVKHARTGPSGKNKLPVERQLPLKPIPALVTKAWRERKAAEAASYQQQYYLTVTKPKRQAARKRKAAPLLMHRPRLTVRVE